MKKYADLNYSDELKVTNARKLMKEVKEAIRANDDGKPHPYRKKVRCIDEVLLPGDGDVFFKMQPDDQPHAGFWVPARMLASGTKVSLLGDEGELWVQKIWAVYNGWR